MTTEQLFRALTPDPDDRKPLYLQVGDRLRDLIAGGTLRLGDAIPPERELAEMTGVSRVTIRKALGQLVEAGILNQKPGAGTFVAGRIEQPLSILLGFSEDMRARGYEPGSIWLDKCVARANSDEAMALGIAPGNRVIRLKRIRTANGQPMAIEAAVISQSYLPAPDAVGDSFYDALKTRDLLPVRALQRIRARLATSRERDLLRLDSPDAVLEIERRSFLADGRVLEVTFSSYRADLYDFVVELRHAGEP
ncbi:GntR family transcriptional regulator [Gluconacetobacter sacchari]|uniref:GntR family transcriptional regulator n=2 Tax=Gluconacetobacter sacchari TaxID=92759 RepID=A0A7W4NMU2_9PROT|nr:GntR family transcriptional regulator [Gluconacetobacter sacchari]MBB2160709.1 GntR family transcriptional regulator [Gluconacetobacter sacchari]